jgi:hypothetical protein
MEWKLGESNRFLSIFNVTARPTRRGMALAQLGERGY